MFEKEIAEKKRKFAEMENSVSDEGAREIYNRAIYDYNPLGYGMRTFGELSEKEVKAFNRIIAATRERNGESGGEI